MVDHTLSDRLHVLQIYVEVNDDIVSNSILKCVARSWQRPSTLSIVPDCAALHP